MAYDEQLVERIRGIVGDELGYGEKKMFGGVCFLLHGNMVAGVATDDLMVRVGPDAWAEALAQPHAREMDFTGRSMKGFVFVEPAGLAEDADLRAWIDRGLAFAGALPPKERSARATKKAGGQAKKPSGAAKKPSAGGAKKATAGSAKKAGGATKKTGQRARRSSGSG